MRLPVPLATAALTIAGVVASPAVARAQGVPSGQFTPPGSTPPAGQAPPSGQFQPPPPAPAAPAPDPFGGMNAGGLAPPPPSSDAPPATPPAATPEPTTDDELDRSKEEDAGRGLTWFWVEAGGGFEHVGLATLSDDAMGAGAIETTSSGAVLDGGVGARLLFVTLGARGRMGFFAPWNLARVGGEAGIRLPIGRLEPRADLGFGYAALTGVSNLRGGAIDQGITGFYGRLGAGLDVFPTAWLALGGGVSWEVLGLTRPALTPAESGHSGDAAEASGNFSSTTSAELEGSGVGSSVAITARVGLHF